MRGTRLMQQINALSDQDLIAFRKYLAANGPGQLQTTFEYLMKYRNGPESRLTKPMLFRKLFPDKKTAYNDVLLRNLMSRLGRHIETWLIQAELEEEEATRRQLLLRAYRRRAAHGLFETEISNRLKKLEQEQERGISFFREQAMLFDYRFFRLGGKDFFKSGKDTYFQLIQNFENWFILGILAYQGDFLVRNLIVNEENPSRFVKIILDQMDPADVARENPVIEVLLRICKLPASGLHFENLHELYASYRQAFPLLEAFECHIINKALISKTNLLIRTDGDARLVHLLFNLYKEGLQGGIYQDEEGVHVNEFIGMAITGATVGDFEWTEQFVARHGPLIEEKERKNALLLSNAYLDYNKGKRAAGEEIADQHFGAAMLALNEIGHQQPDYELRVRSLQLRIFYDYYLVIKKDGELLNEFSKNFRQYLHHQDNRLAAYRVQAYLDFIHYTLKLARLHYSIIKEPLKKLEKIVLAIRNKTSEIMMKHWLLEKAEELGKLLR